MKFTINIYIRSFRCYILVQQIGKSYVINGNCYNTPIRVTTELMKITVHRGRSLIYTSQNTEVRGSKSTVPQ